MKTLSTISSAVVGTAAMTLFSYLTSRAKKKDYVEPEVLGKVIKGYAPDTSEETSKAVGWNAHFGIGIVFAAAYARIWEKTPLKPGLISGAALGAVSGVVGIAGWNEMFNLSESIPVNDKKKYYKHLLLAHVIFGMGAAIGYKIFDTLENKNTVIEENPTMATLIN